MPKSVKVLKENEFNLTMCGSISDLNYKDVYVSIDEYKQMVKKMI